MTLLSCSIPNSFEVYFSYFLLNVPNTLLLLLILIIRLILVNIETLTLPLFEYFLTVLKYFMFQPLNNLLNPYLPSDSHHCVPVIRTATHNPQDICN